MSETPLWIWPIFVCGLAWFCREALLRLRNCRTAKWKPTSLAKRLGVCWPASRLFRSRFTDDGSTMRVVQRIGLGPQQQLVHVSFWGREWAILLVGNSGGCVLAERSHGYGNSLSTAAAASDGFEMSDRIDSTVLAGAPLRHLQHRAERYAAFHPATAGVPAGFLDWETRAAVLERPR